ncbi:uncharacterized protein [Palaemon carinicauda]|uniref:uncharacterized protein n=1 Tax=Palaemon carinicauda TaxID=392227 RepID=UPI0035B61DC2
MRPATLLSIEAACFFLQTFLSIGHPSSLPDISFHRAKRQNFNNVDQIQQTGSNLFIDEDVDDASTGKVVPNSWLYRFPPWFLPHNPPPDGFAIRGSNDILKDTNQINNDVSVEQQQVKDEDVIIVSDFVKSNRQGRLHNVKIPGGTLYRDAVIQTIVDFSLGKNQQDDHSPVDGIVFEDGGISVNDDRPGIDIQNGITIQDEAPIVIPPNVPLPPINIPHRSVVTTSTPKSQNNDGLFTKNGVNIGKLPGSIRISPHLVNNNLQPDVSTKFGGNIPKLGTGEFRPSPPDLSFNRLQPQFNRNPISTFPYREFNPSPPGTPSNHRGLPVQGPTSFSKPSQANSQFRPPIPHNSIGSGLIKNNNRQQTSTLSDFISHTNNNNNNNNQRRPLWVPVIPNVPPTVKQPGGRISPLPFGQTPQTIQGQHFQRGKQGIIQTNIRSNISPSRPASIQDIINSNYDTAQILQGRERNSGHASKFPPSGTSSGNVAQQNDRWLWHKSS